MDSFHLASLQISDVVPMGDNDLTRLYIEASKAKGLLKEKDEAEIKAAAALRPREIASVEWLILNGLVASLLGFGASIVVKAVYAPPFGCGLGLIFFVVLCSLTFGRTVNRIRMGTFGPFSKWAYSRALIKEKALAAASYEEQCQKSVVDDSTKLRMVIDFLILEPKKKAENVQAEIMALLLKKGKDIVSAQEAQMQMTTQVRSAHLHPTVQAMYGQQIEMAGKVIQRLQDQLTTLEAQKKRVDAEIVPINDMVEGLDGLYTYCDTVSRVQRANDDIFGDDLKILGFEASIQSLQAECSRTTFALTGISTEVRALTAAASEASLI